MAKGTRGRRGIASRQCRATPYPWPSTKPKDMNDKKCLKFLVKKDWEDATCSVCMEYPHNAVLLLCSFHDKGCRPYMCGTSFRYSNCLDQYKKAYTKMITAQQNQSHGDTVDNAALNGVSSWPVEKCEVTELSCPLCRGQVKGWTVVEPVRQHLNAKKRSCMQDNCSFVGNYKELRKHVKVEHPSARPREVDPVLEQKWRSLERERERDDVISTIRSSMPNAVVFGDYVIEGSHYGFDTDEDRINEVPTGWDGEFDRGVDSNWLNVLLLLQAIGSAGNNGLSRGTRRRERESNQIQAGAPNGVHRTMSSFAFSDEDSDSGNDGDSNNVSLVSRLRRQGRALLGRSGRRRRRREANGGRRQI